MAQNPTPISKTPSSSSSLPNKDEIQKAFDHFDANGDGKISSSELGGVLKALGSDTSADDLGRMMEEIDTDKDGHINLHEFAAFYNSITNPDGATAEATVEKELREAFKLYDQDQDGKISAAELHLILGRLGEHCSEEDCAVMIKSVDSDGDGYVSFDEFRKMMTKNK
ncbi:hypothetical protein BUALT_Bualt02G0082600 [Buddleja alternifolia]|uniref:EF-hand domain-containing protein n=1 Tax=Buddleja alternifolia TaxID=168488 RepID=A0AAV6Y945_9LAMI|nr:hypothetical protein BUALT_Bualt02G0082600 [Buddleja alternifolia]